MKKILVVSNLYPPYHFGGYGILCQHLVEALADRGHEMVVLTSVPQDLHPSAAPTAGRGRVDVRRELRHGWPESTPRLLRNSLTNRRAVRRLAAEFRPDLVYCFGMNGVGYNTYHAASTLGVPCLTVVGDTWLGQAWRDLAQYDRWVALATGRGDSRAKRLVKRTIGWTGRRLGLYGGPRPERLAPVQAISRYLLSDLQAAGAPVAGAGWVLPCPLPRAYFTPKGEPVGRSGGRAKPLRALFVSRIERLKGPDTAIEGLADAVAAGSDVTLTLSGFRPDATGRELDELARSLGVADRVTWADAPDMAALIDLYRSHDVFLFPSRIIEGFGIVNAEAMACGLPVIGTTTSGAADIILDGVTGLSIGPGDHQELGSHLTRLATDRSLLEQLAAGALARVRRHHPDRILDAVESLIDQILADHRPCRRAVGTAG